MKIATVIEKFKGSETFVCCPLCKGRFSLSEGGSFVCQNGHCFDLSTKGYVHLLGAAKSGNERYGGELFANRRAVFQAGFYEPVAREIAGLAARYMPQNRRTILDAGCGEGYYARFLARETHAEVYGMDNSKVAVLAAAKQPGDVRFMVADLANMPVQGGAAGLILNILTPANYSEFARILGENGAVIKAVPGERYLRELRVCVFGEKEYSNKKIIGHMEEQTDIAERKTIEYTLNVTQEQLSCFYKMTPMTTHAQADAAALSAIRSITIHMELLVLYPRKR